MSNHFHQSPNLENDGLTSNYRFLYVIDQLCFNIWYTWIVLSYTNQLKQPYLKDLHANSMEENDIRTNVHIDWCKTEFSDFSSCIKINPQDIYSIWKSKLKN